MAGSVELNGQLLADGLVACGGAGSGGGVLLEVGMLRGSGSIRAAGGSNGCGNGGGGGGRIAVYAGDWSGFNLANITAPGGSSDPPGGAGTVYLHQGALHTHARYTVPGQFAVFRTNNYVFPLPRVFNDNLAIHFSKAINTNSLSPDKLVIQGPVGPVVCSGVSEIGDRLYRFAFPPQTEQGAYRFTLLPTLLDIEGFPLDQDLDGIPGEPEDAFNFTLVLDTIPPHITQHAPGGDVAGTLSEADVWFSEAIDTNTFTTGDLTLLNPADGVIAVTSIRPVGLNRLRFSFPPQTGVGQYRVRVGANIADLAGNQLDQDGDGAQGENPGDRYDFIINLVQVDLQLTGVTPSANEFWAGETATVSWTGRNATGAPLLGNWLDAVYLSPDPFWGFTDIRVATIQHTGGLGENEVYTTNATFQIPGAMPGNYHFVVRADIGNQTRETVESNNAAASEPVAVKLRELLVGGTASGTLTPTDRLRYFTVSVLPGESLRLRLKANSGVSHLLVNLGSIPTRQDSDARGVEPKAEQSVTLSGVPAGGTYYVLLSGEQVAGTTAFELVAETAPLFVNRITPDRFVGGVSPRFWVEPMQIRSAGVTLQGSGFDRNTRVEFVGASLGGTQTPDQIEFLSPTTLRLNMLLSRWPSDIYSVRVTKGAAVRVLTNAFTVLTDGEAKFEATVTSSGLSPGGGQTLYIHYANIGTRPMPVPLLKVTAYTNAVITTDRLNTRPQDMRNSSLSGGRNQGSGANVIGGHSFMFRVGVPLHTAQVMAVGKTASPGILLPGERGVVPVYFGGLLKDQGEQAVHFSLGSLTADDTTIIDCGSPAPGIPSELHFPRHGRKIPLTMIDPATGCPETPFTPNWTQMATNSLPETVDPAGWAAVWRNLQQSSGPLWADYVLMLGDNMNHLARINQSTNDPGALFNFELLQATAALNPVRTLASAVDATAPGPGFPLVFRRTFAQPILSRYKPGPLGRGWTHNWDIRIRYLDTFQGVVVQGPSGSERFFGRYNDGVYTATGGDNARLIVTNQTFRLIEADQTTWVFATNQFSALLRYVEDPNGNRITCGYAGTQLRTLTHSSGRELKLVYTGALLTSVTDPLGPDADDDRVTTYEYDGSGEHLVRVTAPGDRVTTYTYDAGDIPQRRHALTRVTHPDLTADTFAYDDQGRLVATSQNCCPGTQMVTYTYDSAGTVTVTDATGRQTRLLYGLGGQLAQVQDGEGRIVNFAYDSVSRLTELLGPGGERYRYAYDALGNLSAIEDPLRHTNTFAYHPDFNRLARVVDARGNGMRYSYDARGNLTAIAYADDSREGFTYDARGNVITSTNRRGGVIAYTYNASGQLTAKDYSTTPGVPDFTYEYDPAGNLTSATYLDPLNSQPSTLNLSYSPTTDRLTRIEYPDGKFFDFEYDAVGRRTRRTDQDGNVTAYLYDALGRLQRMTNQTEQLLVEYAYDAAGRLDRKTLGNGVFTTYQYNAAGQVTALVNHKPDATLLSSYEYTYDASGRRDSMTVALGYEFPRLPAGEDRGEGVTGTFTYTYDPLGQLTGVTHPTGRVVTYTYDAAGNRIRVTDNGEVTPYAANPLNQYTTVGADTFLYDADGNLTNQLSTLDPQLSTTYTYDIENRLIGVATPADSWAYGYDAFGNRIASAHNGQTTRYVIDPTGLGNVAAEYDGGGSLIARYEHGFGLLAGTDAAGDPAFYTFSAIGHTSELTDLDGAVDNAYAYDPFGLSLAQTETIPNAFEFVGEFGVINETNGLEFMRARYYVPVLGRYMQPDPIGIVGGTALYSYVANRPSTRIDASGLSDDGSARVYWGPSRPDADGFDGCTGAPDRIGDVNVGLRGGPCHKHDECYGNPGGRSRAACDVRLLFDIYGVHSS
ncbi:MAG: hypothetical protein HS113_29105 [Verrucomicrobiales bacterium]|nr:hypothetical protein [Verrucomicrobiales bacterium]